MAARDPLVGEPLALDLLNTQTASMDHLATLEGLRAWLARQADRLPDPGPAEVGEFSVMDLEAVRHVREHTGIVLAHLREGVPPPGQSVDRLNDAQRVAPTFVALAIDGMSVTALPKRIGPAGRRLAAWLAEASADLLSGSDVERVRRCEASDCVMLFVANHPRRRWCAPDRCGNRIRVARHHRRHTAGE